MSTQPQTAEQTTKSAIVREIDRTMAEAFGAESIEDALDVLAQQIRLMIGAHQSAVSYFPDRSFHNAVHAISLSDKYEKYKSYDVMPTGEGIWAVVVDQKVSFCMTHEELISHPRWRNFSDLKDARGLEHPPMRGWLAVPVVGKRGNIVGLLQLSDKYVGEFNKQDLDLLTHLAALISPTCELQSVYLALQKRSDELKQKTAELERFNKLAVGRELRMIDLKREVNEYALAAGKKPPYDLSFAD